MTLSRIRTAAVVAAAWLAAAAAAPASAQVFGANLVRNGDAETNSTVPFAATGGFQTVAYDQGGFPGAGDPGVAQGGGFFFGGGTEAFSTGAQTYDVSAGAADIDAGGATYLLSALLGGFDGQDDHASLAISFLGAAGNILGAGALGPVLAADRNGVTGLFARSAQGAVPIGTRTIDLTLSMIRTSGTYNDGYADNLSLVLQPGAAGAVPEPASWAMLIAGFGLTGAARRRRGATRVALA